MLEPVQGWENAEAFTANVVTIPNYTDTTRKKLFMVDAKMYYYTSAPAYTFGINLIAGGASTTSAVQTITFTNGFGGNLAIGSEIVLYGITKA
jgi:hypothetical protein